jgi:hypothetical protein
LDVLTTSVEALVAKENYMRNEETPHNVLQDRHYCNQCNRRFLWRADAKLDTVWYNWLEIGGEWDIVEDCYRSYYIFFAHHKSHEDPVCFRAAIFCRILAHWCKEF